MKTFGNAEAYSTGSTSVPLPRATSNGVRPTHAPQRSRPTGLDWSAHRAPDAAPEDADVRGPAAAAKAKCRSCKRTAKALTDGLCKTCHDLEVQAEQRFTPDPHIEEAAPAAPRASAPGDRSDSSTTRTAREADGRAAQHHPPAEQETRPAPPAAPTTPVEGAAPGASASAGASELPTPPPAPHTPGPRRFVLDRQHDVSGVSGTGIVVEGVQFTDGVVATRWTIGNHRSTVIWACVEDVLEVHGHDGATVLRWLDDQPTTAPVAASGPAPATPATRTTEPATGLRLTLDDFPSRRPRTRGPGVDDLDVTELRRRVEEGETDATIGAAMGCSTTTVARARRNAGIQAQHGGFRGKILIDDPQIVADVRRLYLDEKHSQSEVAAKLGVSENTVKRVMDRHDIPGREGQGFRGDGAVELKRLMEEHGVTSKDVRSWAREQGRETTTRGLVKRELLDAYLAAHPDQGGPDA